MPGHALSSQVGMMTVLAAWFWVLTGFLSVVVAENYNLSALYPPLWEDSPEQLSDYRLEDGKYIINPWAFTDRMGMYRILLNKTAPYFERFAPENEQNILWGLPLQFGWQYTTGRLADPTGRTDCGYDSGDDLCISVDSWWADINYFLSVLPFLAAVDTGILGISSDQITILPPPDNQSRFCYNVSGCQLLVPEVMNNWSDFYEYIQSPSTDFDGLLKYLWRAHISSLHGSVSVFEDRYAYYSDQEASFEENWEITVHYLGAARFPTTLNRIHSFQKGMPPRILVDTDIAPFIADFTPLQNEVLVLLQVIGDTNRLTGSSSLTAWKILMSSKLARDLFLKGIEVFLGV